MMRQHTVRCASLVLMLAVWSTGARLCAEDAREGRELEGLEPPADLTPLAPGADVWIDLANKRVLVDGRVAVREGALEMFACPQGTKEHESVVAVNSRAQYVHAALLAIGARSGRPVQFEPEYIPASGSVIEISVQWRDPQGNEQTARAQEWIRNAQTKDAMKHDWVFAGSGFWTDPANGQRFYHGDGGDFICVSNFPTATLDLPVASSQANDSLLFEAFTEHIPPRGTPVRLVLTVKASATDAPPTETQ